MAFSRLRRLIKTIRPDVIHAWMYHANIVASLVGKSLVGLERAKIIWGIRHSLDNLGSDSISTRRAVALSRILAGGADRIAYNSLSSARQHEAYGFPDSKTVLIPNGFDTDRWRPDDMRRESMRKELGLNSEAIVVGFVGRYNAIKNIASFLRVIAPLMEKNERIHAVIVGRNNGPENPELRSLLKRLPQARTHVLGQRIGTEGIFPAFDIFCLSSTSEAFPNVVGEAMSCGVPVVSTMVGDASHIVGKTGYLAEPNSDNHLGQCLSKIISLSENERQRLGQQARARIIERFSKTEMIDKYRHLYQNLAAGTH